MTIQIDTTTSTGIVLIIAALGTLVGATAGAIVTVLSAIASARGRSEVKATADIAAHNAAVAVTRTTDLLETTRLIHDKADTAIKQNEQIALQTDGHYSEMMELLAQLVEAIKQRPVVVAPENERKVRATDLERDAATKRGQ
jgi:hypothetical protein